MAEPSGRSRSRKAERCPTCGSRKYRIDNGLRFCRNCGAQQEGYVQYDMGDEADAGLMGSVSRHRKEKVEKEKRHLTGLRGKSLYLEALQLVVRQQLLWLVREKGHIAELDTVVRDLWAARIANFPDDGEESEGDQGSQMFSSSGFSSGEEEVDANKRKAPHARSWDPDSSSNWPAPSMIDTLALCYLGCLLLRLPTTICEFHHWANNGNIPFRAAYLTLPQEMQDRMPAEFTKQLKRPRRERLADTSLHHAVFDLACSFHLNYSMMFPSLNVSTTLVFFVKILAVPVETAVVAMHLFTVLSLSSQFPIKQARVYIVDHPEIQVMALLIVAAKLCYPMDGAPAALSWIDSLPQLDWASWKAAYDTHNPEPPPPQPEKYKDITATQVAAMTGDELNEYLAYLAGSNYTANETGVTAFFPKPVEPPPAPPLIESSAAERLERTRAIIYEATARLGDSATQQAPETVPGSNFVSFVTVDALPENARGFYQAAANVVGTSLPEMTRAVRLLENKMRHWGQEQGRSEQEANHGLNHGITVAD